MRARRRERRLDGGRPILSRPVSPLERAWRWSRRNRAVAALAASLVFVILGGFVVLSMLLKEARAGRRAAENHYKIASQSLKDALEFNGWNNRFSDASDRAPDEDHAVAVLGNLRNHQIQLREARPADSLARDQLAAIDLALGRRLEHRRDFLQARRMQLGAGKG